jgi:hypothetical protein
MKRICTLIIAFSLLFISINTVRADDSCTLGEPRVSRNNDGSFNVDVAANASGLSQGPNYQLIIDSGLTGDIGGNIGASSDIFSFRIPAIPSSWAGSTHLVYVKQAECFEAAAAACAIGGEKGPCVRPVFFDPNAGPPQDLSTLELPRPAKQFTQFDGTCDTTAGEKTGIQTAIGCVPIGNVTAMTAFALKWALGVAGGVAFLMILVAGYRYMTSKGSPQLIQEAKSLLTAAVYGLLLIIFSIFVLRLIGVNILGLF